MGDLNFSRDALSSSKNKYECRFDPALAPLKRNLLFVSILSFAALIVAPKDGEYSINLGVISGVIEKPELIFCGLLVVCVYHVYLFWLKCRNTVINSINFSGIETVYMNELASLHAFHEWNKLVKTHLSRSVNMAVGSFTPSPKSPRENGRWKVRSEIQSTHLSSHQEFFEALHQSKLFEVGENRGFAQIDFIYKPKPIDYQFLNIHRDHFWLTKKNEFIDHVLPILLGFVAILFLTYRLAILFQNGS